MKLVGLSKRRLMTSVLAVGVWVGVLSVAVHAQPSNDFRAAVSYTHLTLPTTPYV